MKKVLLSVIITLLIPSTGYSQDNEKICEQISDLARGVMEARQSNAPITELKKSVSDNKNIPKKAIEITNIIINLAYSRPRFSSEENQQNEIIDFQNEIYLHCIANSNEY